MSQPADVQSAAAARRALLERIAALSGEQRAAFERMLNKQPQMAIEASAASIPRRADRGPAPLSFAQQRLWFLDRLVGANPFYNQLAVMRLPFVVDCPTLEHALRELIRRHESLRTRFASVDGQPMQIIEPELPFTLEVADLRHIPADCRETESVRQASEEAHKTFDLTRAPLFRTRILKFDDAHCVLILTLHHIISDGWSSEVFGRELSQVYDVFRQGRPSPLPPLPIQYADYAVWQRERLAGPELERDLAYWRERLADLPSLELPTDRARPPQQSFAGGACRLIVPPSAARRLEALARSERCTLFMGLLAVFALLLQRYARQDVVVIGTPVGGRERVELEGLIGFFVNTLVLRCDCSGDPSFRELLRRMREVAVGAYAHQEVPFERLVEELQPAREGGKNPLFQVTLQLQSTGGRSTGALGVTGSSELGGAMPSSVKGTAVFDLAVNLWHGPDEIAGFIEYSRDLYDEATIERMAAHFANIVDRATAAPDEALSAVRLLSYAEQRRLVVDWNDTQRSYNRATTLHAWLHEQAGRTAQATAVVCGDVHLTYRELDRQAGSLATRLRARGVSRGSRVAVYLERTPELPIALIGVLKAGAAYVPIDPAYPSARIEFILNDSAAVAVVTTARLAAALGTAIERVLIDRTESEEASENGAAVSAATAEDIAYVLYTSGSTGQPKGALITHRGIVNYLKWCQDAYGLESGRGAPVHSSISFDLTLTGLFSPLISGREVHLLPDGADATALAAYLRHTGGFSLVKITPAQLRLLAAQVPAREAAGLTRAFVIGGEPLTAQDIEFWRRNAPETALFNEYGPTEAVVGCCVYRVTREDRFTGCVPIGRPINNARLYVLDERRNVVPIGVAGELYIGGEGIAAGYLNRPELTAAKFVPDPFGDGPRLYRTGDLVRHRSDGQLEFLGRMDDQVKIRGCRVELGEVEAALSASPLVNSAAVLIESDAIGENRLVAYLELNAHGRDTRLRSTNAPLSVAAAANCSPDDEDALRDVSAELRQFLAERLPEFMLPGRFVPLEAMPLTANGKIDRRALRAIPSIPFAPAPGASEPHTRTERRLAQIWCELLKVGRVGSDQNFFTELGGHSLLALRLTSRIREAFGRELPLRTVFERPTLAEMARAIEELQAMPSTATEPIRRVSRPRL
jgi:amino acid adenylation domain-containing protein